MDLYVGGAEHAVLHLLYSRFWHKALFDLGIVSTDEPYTKLFNQGMILAFAYETEAGAKVSSDLVEERDGSFFHTGTGEKLTQIVAKMSKNAVRCRWFLASYSAILRDTALQLTYSERVDFKLWIDTKQIGFHGFAKKNIFVKFFVR